MQPFDALGCLKKRGDALPPPRTKKCRNPECRHEFVPARPMQAVCCPACAIALVPESRRRAEAKRAKLDRAEMRAAKAMLKSRSDYLREAQAVVNRYVRLRDAHLGCVSCDKPESWQGQWHASHFRSVGAAPHLRFNLWNIHKACSVCNHYLGGNIMAYRPELVARIGADRVQWLESSHERAGHDVEYLKRLKRIFSKKCRRLEARRR